MAIERETLKNDIENILIKAGIRPTPARILVLKALIESENPLSAQDIDSCLDTLDRSSITRTLPILTDAHLIHQFSDGSGAMKYEYCQCENHDDVHDDQHVHFHCIKCGKTECMPHLEIKVPELPEGYKANSVTFVIGGVCSSCNP